MDSQAFKKKILIRLISGIFWDFLWDPKGLLLVLLFFIHVNYEHLHVSLVFHVPTPRDARETIMTILVWDSHVPRSMTIM